jgi:hypothetical protein
MPLPKLIGVWLLAGFLMVPVLMAAEVRTWTDNRGRTLEGEFLELTGEKVRIRLTTGKDVEVERKTLSALDNEYLAEYGGAESALIEGGRLGIPEKEARIDTKTFKKLDDIFSLPGTELEFEILETEHFRVMTDGRLRPNSVAETAERMWHGMVFQHPSFRKNWGEERRAILLVEEEETWGRIGEWYARELEKMGQDGAMMNLTMTWPKSSGSTITLPQDFAEEEGLARRARVYRVSKANEDSYEEVFTPFVTNTIAADMMAAQTGGVSSFGAQGYFSILTGHAYYKEIQLAGKSGTSIISTEEEMNEIATARGFADGTSWAKELKSMVRKGDAVPSINALYYYQAQTLTSVELVLLYSFSYFLQSDPVRLAAYSKMGERINTSQQMPEAIELAKLFGFDSIELLEEAWTEFVSSTKFK